jgi:hypothetical protein
MQYLHFYNADDDRTYFVLACTHANTQLALEGLREDDAPEVLGNLIETHRTAVIAGNEHLKEGEEGVICLCQPSGWIRGEPFTVR